MQCPTPITKPDSGSVCGFSAASLSEQVCEGPLEKATALEFILQSGGGGELRQWPGRLVWLGLPGLPPLLVQSPKECQQALQRGLVSRLCPVPGPSQPRAFAPWARQSTHLPHGTLSPWHREPAAVAAGGGQTLASHGLGAPYGAPRV